MKSGNGTTILTVKSPDKNEEIRLDVSYSWYYDAGVRYHADGTGTPPDGEISVESFEAADGEPIPAWLTENLVQEALEEADLDYN